MELKEGVKIYSNLSLTGKILLSAGIENTKLLNDIPCDKDTFVPKEPWRVPTSEEKKILIEKTINREIPAQSVCIFRLNDSLIKLLKQSGIQRVSSNEELSNFVNKGTFLNTYQKLVSYLSLFQGIKEQPKIQAIGCGPKGLKTSSLNIKTNKYAGIHVDSWEMKPIEERHLARNRILVNLGKNPRFFMFINIQMKYINNFISYDKFNEGNKFDYLFENIHLFLKENSNYPIIKIKINPFEGYIAPTENIIHDGNTEGQEIMDIFLTIRSFYGIKPSKLFTWKIKNLLH